MVYSVLDLFTFNLSVLCLLCELCGIALCEQCLYLLIYILTSVAKFLVEHLVRSRETEALETPDATICTYKSFESNRQSGCHTELLLACWQNALLILLRLAAEKSL